MMKQSMAGKTEQRIASKKRLKLLKAIGLVTSVMHQQMHYVEAWPTRKLLFYGGVAAAMIGLTLE